MAHDSNLIKRISLGGIVYDVHDEQAVHTLADLENYAICPTTADDCNKIATIQNGDKFTLKAGVQISVKFDYANTVNYPVLNVNNSGNKDIYYQGSKLTTKNSWNDNQIVNFVYDGSYWHAIGLPGDKLFWGNF